MAKKTQVEREYLKQEQRIKQFIRRATKRGFSFPETAIPPRPNRITKRSVQKLQKITPSSLYEKGSYIDPTSGTIYTGKEGRKQERSKASQKGHAKRRKLTAGGGEAVYIPQPRESSRQNTSDEPVDATEQIISNIVDQIENELERWTPSPNWTEGLTNAKEKDKDKLSKMFHAQIKEIGRVALAQRLEDNASEINALIAEILYASGSKEGNFKDGRTQVNADLARMADILTGHMLTPQELRDITEQTEAITSIDAFDDAQKK